MKPSHAANLAVALSVVGWLMSFHGAFSQLGDPAAQIPREKIEEYRQTSISILFIGITTLLSALCLSDYAFAQAKWRSSIALIACLVPFTLIYVFEFMYRAVP